MIACQGHKLLNYQYSISHKAFVPFSACFIIFPRFFVSFPFAKLQEQAPQVASPAAPSVRSYHILFVVRRRCPSVGTTLQGLGLTRLPDVKVLELNLEGGNIKWCPSLKLTWLGGGNSNIFGLFSPRKLGKMNPIWLIFFKLVQPPTSEGIFPAEKWGGFSNVIVRFSGEETLPETKMGYHGPWKWIVGRRSFPFGYFSGANR